LQLLDCNGFNSQSWGYEDDAGPGAIHFRATKGAKCTDLPGGDQAAGNKIEIWDCLGNENQQFDLAFVGY